MMPERLTSPTVGLMPTSALTPDGQTIDPSVSVPTPTAARFAAIAAPVPELDPQGLRSSTYGFLTWPPRPLQPLVDFVDRKLAHSLRFVLPRITAPAARRRPTTNASRAAVEPCSASDPAVVIMRSPVSMLSLMSTGIPCSGPRTPARPALGVQRVGNRQRVGIELDDRPQRRTAAIDGLDARGVELDEPSRRVAAGRHRLLQLGNRHFIEIERRRGLPRIDPKSCASRRGGQ